MNPRGILEKNKIEILKKAARAPSVHNTQPARWKISEKVSLWGNPDAWLRVGDPSQQDHFVSIGAAFEYMQIALSEYALTLGQVQMKETRAENYPHEILEAEVMSAQGGADLLSLQLLERHSYRGVFKKPDELQIARLNSCLDEARCKIIVDPLATRHILDLGDQATLNFMNDEKYVRELYSWMRFSPLHPRWDLDGLNADVLKLKYFERMLAAKLLQPKTFKALNSIRLGSAITGEAAKHAASSIFILILKREGESPFENGRHLARQWLEITRAGFAVCPVSAIVDDPATNREVTRMCGIQNPWSVMNVFRAGIVPAGEQTVSPRIPVQEILL